jgi:sugar phosphate isomerase/epimerase
MRRRTFLHHTALAAASVAAPSFSFAQAPARRFTMNLVTGMIGVAAKTQAEVNAFATRHGFESVEARGPELAAMDGGALAALKDAMARDKLVWGAGFLPNDTRPDAAKHEETLKDLPAFAAGLQRAGVTRVGTWISPASDSLTYRQNFARHVERVRAIGRILGDHGVRFGLEYIGTPTLRRGRRHSFIHTMAETRELLAEIDVPTVGFILDSWHWWTSGDTAADIRTLRNQDIVAVDLNDAPAGVPLEDQKDNQRELPGATGVIPIRDFVAALIGVGYDGPARAEPFNAVLNALEDDDACARTIAAVKRVVAAGL